ncbi:MAG: phosphoribosylanthranilate isomerase [Prevotella sp.]|nr:phosphoribosylanthranilate isomerase [Prevotella sp.]
MIIKVCGMTDAENIRQVRALGVDIIGLIFAPKSPRYIPMASSLAGIIPDYAILKGQKKIKIPHVNAKETTTISPTNPAPEGKRHITPLPFGEGQGGEALDGQGPSALLCGVFVDDMPQNIVTRVYNYHLSYVQLHGHESPVMIDNLRRTLDPDIAPGIKIIKALPVKTADDLKATEDYEGHVDLFLFDAKGPLAGGNGTQYDWDILRAYHGNTPFLLSGGIGPDDVDRVKAFHHPMFRGIDLNSKFEIRPGYKDVEKLRKFIESLRS